MNKHKKKDFSPSTDQEAANYIKDNLSSNKKLISQNYTKQNFKYFKKNFPQLWDYVKGKKIIIEGKEFDFKERIVQPLYINGKLYRDNYSISNKTDCIPILTKYDFNNFNLKTFFEFCVNNFGSGFRPLLIIKNYYPELMKELQIYKNESDNEREVVYRYLNDLKQKPKINNIPLRFHCHTVGYEAQSLYKEWLKLTKEEQNNEHEILKIFIQRLKYEKKLEVQMKHFFPQLYKKINQLQYNNIKFFGTKCWLYYNNRQTLPNCKICGKPVREYRTFSYYTFCSEKCRHKFDKENRLKNNIREICQNNNWKNTYQDYIYRNVKLTKYSYRLFKDLINPNNVKIGPKDYHIDHIISKRYGYDHNIDPMILSHYLNLQVLKYYENQQKQEYVNMKPEEIQQFLNKIKQQLNENNYFNNDIKFK